LTIYAFEYILKQVYNEKEDFMKLLIAGSRSIREYDLSPYIPHEVDTIISGGAEGIDRLAEAYADEHKLSKYVIRPQYARYGRAAPLKRNQEMVDMADVVLVIWDGESKGSRFTVAYAQKQNKPLLLIQI
jgi:predicted Rossmann fold nucleotide-binding protein DprA/Smf involved in DNA uptake